MRFCPKFRIKPVKAWYDSWVLTKKSYKTCVMLQSCCSFDLIIG